jgi:hypothetical protein
MAWHIESSMAMGYRLVPNLLRAKRSADAINVSRGADETSGVPADTE